MQELPNCDQTTQSCNSKASRALPEQRAWDKEQEYLDFIIPLQRNNARKVKILVSHIRLVLFHLRFTGCKSCVP